MHVLHLHGLDVSCFFFTRFFHSLTALHMHVLLASCCLLPPQPVFTSSNQSCYLPTSLADHEGEREECKTRPNYFLATAPDARRVTSLAPDFKGSTHNRVACALYYTSSRAIQAAVDLVFLVSNPAQHLGVLVSSPRHACALPQHSGAATLRCFRKPAASGDRMRVHLCLPAATANFELILPSFNILFMHI
jgi:hypothetical protein